MFNDLPRELHNDDIERNAYNAAFYDLGLRWHWDCGTFDALKQRGTTAEGRLLHYLRTEQPHILRAYDAGFLANAIQARVAQYQANYRSRPSRPCDWSQLAAGVVGH
jgi:hypothetical protein